MHQGAVQFSVPESVHLLIELETRQDDVMERLDELNRRIEQAIVFGQLGVRSSESASPAPAISHG